MATSYVTIAFVLFFMVLKITALDEGGFIMDVKNLKGFITSQKEKPTDSLRMDGDFATRGITIQLPDDFNIDLENGTDFQFDLDARVYKRSSDKEITGSNHWQVSAWFGPASDGSGRKVEFTEQTLNEAQSSTPFVKKISPFEIDGISFSLAPTSQMCRDLAFFCTQLGVAAESSDTVNVVGFPDDGVRTTCVEIECNENLNICVSDGEIYNHGDQWKPSSCESCTCFRNRNVQCVIEQCDIPCDIGDAIYTEGVCCPTCPVTCEYGGEIYDIGARWMTDVCTSCSCPETGEAECVTERCVSSVCRGGVSPIFRPGECCEVCPLECVSDNVAYLHLEEWRPTVCSTCTCYDGTTGCDSETCEVLECDVSKHVKRDDQCCPQCALDCEISPTRTIAHDERWQSDICTTCHCFNGSFDCLAEACDERLGCGDRFIVNRQDVCCPVCGEGCDVEGTFYGHLEEWSPDPCTQCSCYDGVSDCRITRCSQPDCGVNRRLLTIEGQCCPVCSEGDPLYLRATLVKVKFRTNWKLLLKKRSAKLKIIPLVEFENYYRNVTGRTLWKISAWLSSDEDGLTTVTQLDQILNEEQVSMPVVPNKRMNFGKTKLKFRIKKSTCDMFSFACIRFGLTDNPLADGVTLFLHPASVLESCARIQDCEERINIP